jgi:hypothetical protein
MLNTTNSVLLQTVLLLMSNNMQDTGNSNEVLQLEEPKNSKLKHVPSSYCIGCYGN